MARPGSLGGSGRGVGAMAKSAAAGLIRKKFAGRLASGRPAVEEKEDERAMGVRKFRAGNRQLLTGLLLLVSIQLLSSQAMPLPPSFDIVITNGHIVDGTGSPWYSGDVGIRAGKIAAIGNLAAAQRNRT